VVGDSVLRIGLIDPLEIVREGLKLFLETRDDFLFVGEASSPAEALNLCRTQAPQLVLCDFFQDDGDGLAFIRTLHTAFPDLCIVILTTVSEVRRITAAFQAGAVGYLLKQLSIDELADAIRLAATGTRVIHEEFMRLLTVQAYPLTGSWKMISPIPRGMTSQMPG
jgi:two-component system, NarL family, response regulator LiaR